MADFATHDLFGELIACPAEIRDDYPTLFRWGLQGPDLLFYRKALFGGSPYHHIGNLMHDQSTSALFVALARFCQREQGELRRQAEAYFYGFLGHYGLDSVIHPYVFYHQYRLAAKRPHTPGGGLHCQIETDIDIDLYSYLRHQPISRYQPQEGHLLSADHKELLARMFTDVLYEVYGVILSRAEVKAALDEMLKTQKLLYSGSRLVFQTAAAADGLLGKGGILTPHVKMYRPQWDSLNLAQRRWNNPSRPERARYESVPQLLQLAQERTDHLISIYHEMIASAQIREIPVAESFSEGCQRKKQ